MPYAGYYGSYYALNGISAVGDRSGPVGTAVSRVVGAPLVPIEAFGLGLDIGIDYSKPEDWADESKDHCDARPINPLHSIPFVPTFLRGAPARAECFLCGGLGCRWERGGSLGLTWTEAGVRFGGVLASPVATPEVGMGSFQNHDVP